MNFSYYESYSRRPDSYFAPCRPQRTSPEKLPFARRVPVLPSLSTWLNKQISHVRSEETTRYFARKPGLVTRGADSGARSLPKVNKIVLGLQVVEEKPEPAAVRRRFHSDLPSERVPLSYEYLNPKRQKYTQYLQKGQSHKTTRPRKWTSQTTERTTESPELSLLENPILSKYLVELGSDK